VNGKEHTFLKDFDDYDSYREFLKENPEYLSQMSLGDKWNPWRQWDPLLPDFQEEAPLPLDTRHLPKDIDLNKYEKRRMEKYQSDAEKVEKMHSLEKAKAYLCDYIDENPEDSVDAKRDLEKIESEIKNLG
jgi:hypothetical protein